MGIKRGYKEERRYNMFSHLLGIIYREEKVDEVEVKRDKLKSKLLKQVRQDGTQHRWKNWSSTQYVGQESSL